MKKRLCSFAIALIMAATSVCAHVTPVEAGVIGDRVCNELMDIADRAISMGVSKAAQELGIEDNEGYQAIAKILFGITPEDDELSQEILSEVKEINDKVTESTDYLSGMLGKLQGTTDAINLNQRLGFMDVQEGNLDVAWEYYEKCLILAADGDTESDEWQGTLGNFKKNLKGMDFDTQLTNYINYVGPYKAHEDENDKQPISYDSSYMDLVYKLGQNQIVFDHQMYDHLVNGMYEPIVTITNFITLNALYVDLLQYEYDQMAAEGASTEELRAVKEELDMAKVSYEINIKKGVNACNDIAQEYYPVMQNMVRSIDVKQTLELSNYQSRATIDNEYYHDQSVLGKDGYYPISYESEAAATSLDMDFYVVSVNGNPYLFLDQTNLEKGISASNMIQEYTNENFFGHSLHAKGRMESLDWLNFGLVDGKFTPVTNIQAVAKMINARGTTAYSSSAQNSNFLYYVQSMGGLSGVVKGLSNKAPYLFMNSYDAAEYTQGKNAVELYITAKWANSTNMKMSGEGIDSSAVVKSQNFYSESDRDMLFMFEPVESAVLEYALINNKVPNGTVRANGNSYPKINFKAGEQITLNVAPDDEYTLNSLKIVGGTGDSQWEDILAIRGDFENMQKEEDGSVNYYFTMPYQDCKVVAEFGLAPVEYKINYELFGGENSANNPTTYIAGDDTEVLLSVPTRPGYQFTGWYEDAEMKNKTDIVPLGKKGDLTLYAGWAYEPNKYGVYEIPDYDVLCMVASMVNSGEPEYAEATYIVVNDFACPEDSNWTAKIGTKDHPFKGTFDGQGYTISGLNIHHDSSEDYMGLFGRAEGAVIENLHLEDVDIASSTQYVGAICGQIRDGSKIVNCIVTGSICAGEKDSTNFTYGGICGSTYDSTIEKCISRCNINVDWCYYAGGIVGRTYDSLINNCANFGDISGRINYAGGIAGFAPNAKDTSVISNSYNVGKINNRRSGSSNNIIQQYGKIENCYYQDGTGVNSGGIKKSPEEFASGQVAYLLNSGKIDGKQAWYQNIDNGLTPDAHPFLIDNGQNTVYEKEDKSGYTNILKVDTKVTYVLNGGVNGENPSVIKKDETVVLKDASKTGYAFEGWYTDKEFTTACTEITGGAKEVTLYAKWSDPISYTVKYELNGGTNAETNPSSYTIESKEIVFADASREGYHFTGWYEDAELTKAVTSIQAGSTGDVTVYAGWKLAFEDILEPNEDGDYEIDSYEDLIAAAKSVKGNPEKYASATFVQTDNITCGMQEWPLSIGTEEIPFDGTYEGNGYYILGLRPTKDVSGLFGVIGSSGYVKNLSVIDFDYSEAAEYAGGLAGINNGTIDGCGSGVNITSSAMIFRKGQTVAVPITTLDSEIKATQIAGGLIAVNEGQIINCRNNSEVTVTSNEESYAGGIAGQNNGIIMNVYQNGTIAGAAYAGGIAGSNAGYIQYGYNSSKVAGNMAGAIVGRSDSIDVLDMHYEDLVDAAFGNSDEFLQATKMTAAEMKTQAFADTLNALVKGSKFLTWEYDASKNAGYPKFGTEKAEENVMIALRGGAFGTVVENPGGTEGGNTGTEGNGSEGSGSQGTTNNNTAANTGDSSNVMLFAIMLALSAGVFVVESKKKWNRTDEQ